MPAVDALLDAPAEDEDPGSDALEPNDPDDEAATMDVAPEDTTAEEEPAADEEPAAELPVWLDPPADEERGKLCALEPVELAPPEEDDDDDDDDDEEDDDDDDAPVKNGHPVHPAETISQVAGSRATTSGLGLCVILVIEYTPPVTWIARPCGFVLRAVGCMHT
jgi:hypothetical protein